MKRHPTFSDATLLSGILRSYFDTSRKEVTTELAMQKFVSVVEETEAANTRGGMKKRGRRAQDDNTPSEKIGGVAVDHRPVADRCLVALSELQRLGSIRLTGTGHQVRNLMVSWSGSESESR
jgi:hypothetical protein